MEISQWLENQFLCWADRICANIRQPSPTAQKLRNCKIISHRGAYDNRKVFENTLAAFDRIRDRKIWGIELDVRWTKDLYPVVFHDADLKRIFNTDLQLRQLRWKELNDRFPLVPSLETVIKRYGRRMHLMIEIKAEFYPDPAYQNKVLKSLLASLAPQIDFHFLSLTPYMFEYIDFVAPATFLPIAQSNVRQISRIAHQKCYGGILGHYYLLRNRCLAGHIRRNQKIGTGFIRSSNCLCRELNRGVEWLFSNHAIELQEMCNQMAAVR